MQNILSKVDQTFSQVLDVVNNDLSTIKTGRAKPDLVSQIPIKVQSYGATMLLVELASITAPDPQTLVISPWDKNILTDIMRGLSQSERDLNPHEDGDVIRIPIPTLTNERRQELVKLVDQKIEAGKRLLREERKHLKREIDEQKGEAGVSEDDVFRSIEELDNKTRDWEVNVDELGNTKKRELMTL